MATVYSVHGNTQESDQLGRELRWIRIVATNAILLNLQDVQTTPLVQTTVTTVLDAVRKAVDTAASITIIGEATSTIVMMGIESPGFAAATPTDAEQIVSLEALLEAIQTSTYDGTTYTPTAAALGAVTVTFETITGGAFTV